MDLASAQQFRNKHEAFDRQMIAAMEIAGIPARYHDGKKGMSQLKHKGAAILSKWIATQQAEEEIRAGSTGGRFIVGSDLDSLDTFYYTARALLQRRFPVIVYPLPLFVRLLSDKDSGVYGWVHDKNAQPEVLFISDFYNTHFTKAYDESALNFTQWFFRERLLSKRPIIFHSEEPLTSCKWWSPSFIKIVQERCPEIV